MLHLRNESAGKIVCGLNRMFALKTGFSMPRLVHVHLMVIIRTIYNIVIQVLILGERGPAVNSCNSKSTQYFQHFLCQSIIITYLEWLQNAF